MSAVETQDILNRILSLFTNFAKLELDSFDISEEKKIYVDSLPVLFDEVFKDGIAVRFELYLPQPVYILALISKEAIYEISDRMGVALNPDFEQVRIDENALSFTVELINLMTASVADKYARKYNRRVIYSPPKVIRHIFSPNIIQGIEIRNRMANIVSYEFNFTQPNSSLKMLLIY